MLHTLMTPPLSVAGRERSRRRAVVLVLIALLGALLVAFQPPLAAHAAVGSISGNVKGAANANLEGVSVFAAGTSGTSGFGFGYTDSSGNYSIEGLQPGQYTIQFNAPFDSDYLDEYYDNVPYNYTYPTMPTPVTVASGGSTSNINAVLAVGGQISGHVTGAGAGSLEGISVMAVASTFYSYTAFTDAGGDYVIRGLPSGSYKLQFFSDGAGNWVGEWYDNQSTESAAQSVTVTAPNAVTGKNAELASGATISGTVTAEDAPAGLSGVEVYAESTTTDVSSRGFTDGDGEYSVEGLPAGSYVVSFQPPYLDHHYGEYYDDVQNYDQAQPVAVAALATVSGIDASLGLGATLSGTVTGGYPAGPAEGVQVSMTELGGYSTVASASTDADGAYEVVGIPPGQYTLQFTPPFEATTMVGEYWNNSPTLAGATAITTTAGQVLTGYDTQLELPGYISGNIKGPGNVNLAGAFISVQPVDGSSGPGAFGLTDGSGNYQVGGLRAGQYRVYLSPPSTSPTLVGEYWNDTFEYDAATLITVTPASVTANVNAVLVAGGSMSGNVKGPGNVNLAGATVSWSRNGCDCGDGTETDANGNWSVSGLTPGNYTIRFYGPEGSSYISEYYNDSLTLAGATQVVVTSGGSVTGRNAVLETGGAITGTVRNSGSNPIGGIEVSAINTSTGEYYYGYTGETGTYTVPGLPTGSYKLLFTDYDTGYASEYWDNQPSFASATPISVTAGATMSGKDAVLVLGGTISGVVTDAKTGVGIPFAAVAVYAAGAVAADGSSLVTTGYANNHGVYSVSGIPLGSYRLGFTDQPDGTADDGTLLPSSPHVSEWSGNSYTFAAASNVVVSTENQLISGQNAALENPTFADVPDPTSAFYAYIEWMSSSGVSTGTPNPPGKPLYKPANAVSRQAMASFLYKLDGASFTAPVEPTFADVDSSNPFYTAIEWMASEGISVGTAQPSGKPLFKPADPVSRQSMAVFLARYEGIDTTTPPTEQSFADVPTNASTAAAIAWMKTSGISTGTPQPSGLPLYKPVDPVSRQAMAAFLYRLAHLP